MIITNIHVNEETDVEARLLAEKLGVVRIEMASVFVRSALHAEMIAVAFQELARMFREEPDLEDEPEGVSAWG
jgi:hypothetical protein